MAILSLVVLVEVLWVPVNITLPNVVLDLSRILSIEGITFSSKIVKTAAKGPHINFG